MDQIARAASSLSRPRVWVGLGAMFTASCLLTTSLDGLEGPTPFVDAGSPDGGAAGTSEGGPDAEAEGKPDRPIDGGSGDDAGNAGDRATLDGRGEAGDGAAKGPFRVAQAGGALRGIAEHDTDVYWVQGEPSAGIVYAPKAGGQPPMFFDMTSNAFDVAVDADYVYWSTGKENRVYRKPLGSRAPSGEVIFSGAGETLYIAVGTAGRIYVTGANAIAGGPRVDAGTSDALYLMQPGAAGVAVSGSDLFWSVTTGIVRGVIAGQSTAASRQIYGSTNGETGGVAVDAQEIYWITPDGAVRALLLSNPGALPPREVCRSSGDAGDADVDARPDAPGSAAIADVAVDDQWVYFTEPAIGQISKCLKQ